MNPFNGGNSDDPDGSSVQALTVGYEPHGGDFDTKDPTLIVEPDLPASGPPLQPEMSCVHRGGSLHFVGGESETFKWSVGPS
jgi:hypothetical protein